MTWTARATVTDVSANLDFSDGSEEGRPFAIITAVASLDDPGVEISGHTYPTLTSNTEGRVRSVAIEIEVETKADEDGISIDPLSKGDVLQITGHFTA